jgi:Ankyrin repeats (3 copies)
VLVRFNIAQQDRFSIGRLLFVSFCVVDFASQVCAQTKMINENDDGDVDDDDDDEIGYEEEPWRPTIESGNVQRLKDLIQERGLDILTRNYQHNGEDATTALLIAVQNNHVPIVQYLLEHCRSVVNIDDADTATEMDGGAEAWTALHFAAQNGNGKWSNACYVTAWMSMFAIFTVMGGRPCLGRLKRERKTSFSAC